MNNIIYGSSTFNSKYSSKTSQSFAAVLEKTKSEILKNDLWIIAEINPQILLEKEGYKILEARQILFFHPKFMVKLLSEDPSAVMAVPLKVILMKLPDGQVIIQATDPCEIFEKFPKLFSLANELSDIVINLFKSIVKDE